MAVDIRKLDREKVRPGVEAIDTTFETDTIFELQAGARRIDIRCPVRSREGRDATARSAAHWPSLASRGSVLKNVCVAHCEPHREPWVRSLWISRFTEAPPRLLENLRDGRRQRLVLDATCV